MTGLKCTLWSFAYMCKRLLMLIWRNEKDLSQTPTIEAEDRLKNASVKWSDMVFTRHGPDCRSLRNERSLDRCGWRKIDRRIVTVCILGCGKASEAGLTRSSNGWLFLRSITACMCCTYGYAELSLDPEAAVFLIPACGLPHTVLRRWRRVVACIRVCRSPASLVPCMCRRYCEETPTTRDRCFETQDALGGSVDGKQPQDRPQASGERPYVPGAK
jgi:hypothetical protein